MMFNEARQQDTRTAWQDVAATLRAKATAAPKTQDERDAANVAAYCEYRAAHYRGRGSR